MGAYRSGLIASDLSFPTVDASCRTGGHLEMLNLFKCNEWTLPKVEVVCEVLQSRMSELR